MATEVGVKLDTGKNRLGLVLGAFGPALEEVGKVGTFGAQKYTDNGWQTVPNGKARYEDAQLRHFFDDKKGELFDKESQLLHKAHVAWNALAVLTLALQDLKAAEDSFVAPYLPPPAPTLPFIPATIQLTPHPVQVGQVVNTRFFGSVTVLELLFNQYFIAEVATRQGQHIRIAESDLV